MIQIIAILLVAYIIVPLVDLTAAERVRYFVKIAVYLITLLWVVYTVWVLHGGV